MRRSWRAYAAVRDPSDVDAVTAALRGVYLLWLEGLAEQVQGWDGSRGVPPREVAGGTPALPGTVLELNAVVWRVRGLLQAGWRQAVLVTDQATVIALWTVVDV